MGRLCNTIPLVRVNISRGAGVGRPIISFQEHGMSRHLVVLTVIALGLFAASAVAAPGDNSKSGTIKSVDAKAKTFVLAVTGGRDLTFTVNDKTVVKLDGKDSSFDAAIKADQKATVQYTRSGNDRIASTVEVTTVKAEPAK
jgi:hypothetical protein